MRESVDAYGNAYGLQGGPALSSTVSVAVRVRRFLLRISFLHSGMWEARSVAPMRAAVRLNRSAERSPPPPLKRILDRSPSQHRASGIRPSNQEPGTRNHELLLELFPLRPSRELGTFKMY